MNTLLQLAKYVRQLVICVGWLGTFDFRVGQRSLMPWGSPQQARFRQAPPRLLRCHRHSGASSRKGSGLDRQGHDKAVNVASMPGEARPRYRISCEGLAKFQARQSAKLLPAALHGLTSTVACGFFPRRGQLIRPNGRRAK